MTVKTETRPCKYGQTKYKNGQEEPCEFETDGIFHGWGSRIVGSNENFMMETMGVIEDKVTGRVHMIFPGNVVFDDEA